MDFDEEMSSLQIEDLGEYFFPNELTNDNWKGFSLGYGEEDATTSTPSTTTSTVSKPIAIARSTSHARDRSGSLSNSLVGGGVSLNATMLLQDPSLVVSPPMLAPSFSEMLKHTNGALHAAALGLGANDFPMSPTTSQFSTASASASASAIPHALAAIPTDASVPRTKDEQLMDLAGFTLEGRFQRAAKPSPEVLPQRAPPTSLKPAASTVAVPPDGTNTAAVCKRIMDEEEDDEEDEEEDDDLSAKRRSSGASTPSAVFGSKRSFDMVDPCTTSSCATIGAPEDDRGFRKKSREKMRRQEVNVKFDELIDLLGLSNRVRKSAILQEAVSAIKTLKRERDDMRRDRDRLQQEVSKLATCLQYSHLGSVAAANAVAMSQATQSNPHFQPLTAQPMNPHQMPGPGCFPIGGSTFGTPLAPAGGATAPPLSTLNATPIAPKVIKSANDRKP